jgi:hypothetical protein
VMKFITEAITTKDKEVSLDDFRKLEWTNKNQIWLI